jgi:hypothetical protein
MDEGFFKTPCICPHFRSGKGSQIAKCNLKRELNSSVTSCDKAKQDGDVIDSIAIADQAGHILINLVKHDPNSVPPGPG